MNPSSNILALRASPGLSGKQALQVFDMTIKSKLNEANMSEVVEFWKWINNSTIGIVTATAIYHWNTTAENHAKPKKVFDRADDLAGNQIINYVVDPSDKWCLVVGLGKKDDSVIGTSQLYSLERSVSQVIEAHAATFSTILWKGQKRTLFCFANRNSTSSKLLIFEVGQEKETFPSQAVDIYYPPEANQDFPVAIQASEQYRVLFIITKFGYLHVFHIMTGKLIYMNRISAETIFVTAKYSPEAGLIGVNRKGQILTVSIDPTTVITYITEVLKDPDLAKQYARELPST